MSYNKAKVINDIISIKTLDDLIYVVTSDEFLEYSKGISSNIGEDIYDRRIILSIQANDRNMLRNLAIMMSEHYKNTSVLASDVMTEEVDNMIMYWNKDGDKIVATNLYNSPKPGEITPIVSMEDLLNNKVMLDNTILNKQLSVAKEIKFTTTAHGMADIAQGTFGEKTLAFGYGGVSSGEAGAWIGQFQSIMMERVPTFNGEVNLTNYKIVLRGCMLDGLSTSHDDISTTLAGSISQKLIDDLYHNPATESLIKEDILSIRTCPTTVGVAAYGEIKYTYGLYPSIGYVSSVSPSGEKTYDVVKLNVNKEYIKEKLTFGITTQIGYKQNDDNTVSIVRENPIDRATAQKYIDQLFTSLSDPDGTFNPINEKQYKLNLAKNRIGSDYEEYTKSITNPRVKEYLTKKFKVNPNVFEDSDQVVHITNSELEQMSLDLVNSTALTYDFNMSDYSDIVESKGSKEFTDYVKELSTPLAIEDIDIDIDTESNTVSDIALTSGMENKLDFNKTRDASDKAGDVLDSVAENNPELKDLLYQGAEVVDNTTIVDDEILIPGEGDLSYRLTYADNEADVVKTIIIIDPAVYEYQVQYMNLMKQMRSAYIRAIPLESANIALNAFFTIIALQSYIKNKNHLTDLQSFMFYYGVGLGAISGTSGIINTIGTVAKLVGRTIPSLLSNVGSALGILGESLGTPLMLINIEVSLIELFRAKTAAEREQALLSLFGNFFIFVAIANLIIQKNEQILVKELTKYHKFLKMMEILGDATENPFVNDHGVLLFNLFAPIKNINLETGEIDYETLNMECMSNIPLKSVNINDGSTSSTKRIYGTRKQHNFVDMVSSWNAPKNISEDILNNTSMLVLPVVNSAIFKHYGNFKKFYSVYHNPHDLREPDTNKGNQYLIKVCKKAYELGKVFVKKAPNHFALETTKFSYTDYSEHKITLGRNIRSVALPVVVSSIRDALGILDLREHTQRSKFMIDGKPNRDKNNKIIATTQYLLLSKGYPFTQGVQITLRKGIDWIVESAVKTSYIIQKMDNEKNTYLFGGQKLILEYTNTDDKSKSLSEQRITLNTDVGDITLSAHDDQNLLAMRCSFLYDLKTEFLGFNYFITSLPKFNDVDFVGLFRDLKNYIDKYIVSLLKGSEPYINVPILFANGLVKGNLHLSSENFVGIEEYNSEYIWLHRYIINKEQYLALTKIPVTGMKLGLKFYAVNDVNFTDPKKDIVPKDSVSNIIFTNDDNSIEFVITYINKVDQIQFGLGSNYDVSELVISSMIISSLEQNDSLDSINSSLMQIDYTSSNAKELFMNIIKEQILGTYDVKFDDQVGVSIKESDNKVNSFIVNDTEVKWVSSIYENDEASYTLIDKTLCIMPKLIDTNNTAVITNEQVVKFGSNNIVEYAIKSEGNNIDLSNFDKDIITIYFEPADIKDGTITIKYSGKKGNFKSEYMGEDFVFFEKNGDKRLMLVGINSKRIDYSKQVVINFADVSVNSFEVDRQDVADFVSDNHLILNNSINNGDTAFEFKVQTKNASWADRVYFSSVIDSNNNIYIFGGRTTNNGSYDAYSDVWKSEDGGTTWSEVNSNAPWGKISGYACTIDSKDNIYICNEYKEGLGYQGNVWKSSDYGVTWKKVSGDNWSKRSGGSLVVDSEDNIYMLGGRDGNSDIYKSTNGGYNWTKVTENAPLTNVYASVVDSQDNMYIFEKNSNKQAWKSSDSGITWTKIETLLPNDTIETSIVDSYDNIYVFNKYGIWRSSDYCLTWEKLKDETNPLDDRHGYAYAINKHDYLYILGGRIGSDDHGTNDVYVRKLIGSVHKYNLGSFSMDDAFDLDPSKAHKVNFRITEKYSNYYEDFTLALYLNASNQYSNMQNIYTIESSLANAINESSKAIQIGVIGTNNKIKYDGDADNHIWGSSPEMQLEHVIDYTSLIFPYKDKAINMDAPNGSISVTITVYDAYSEVLETHVLNYITDKDTYVWSYDIANQVNSISEYINIGEYQTSCEIIPVPSGYRNIIWKTSEDIDVTITFN